MTNKIEIPQKIVHDLKELSYWIQALSEGLADEDVDAPLKILASESALKLQKVLAEVEAPC